MADSTPQQGSRPATPRPQQKGAPPARVSDAEREAAVERLRVASVEGRLTFAELAERTEKAYLAATRADLEEIVADLPAMGAPGAEPAPPAPRRFGAFLGDCDERISGRISSELEAHAVLGDVSLDLRGAQVPTSEVRVCATAVLGDVRIIVPDGVRVDLTGYAILGDRRVAVRQVAPDLQVPVVRVRAQAVLGDINVVDDEHYAPVRRAVASWWQERRARRHGDGD
ncbi:hypothetical protein Arub01_24240 [Actinomadura rubrobrunea]|uniref:DUF1707 domain-containing protein n=1 Tax=Actinomadura rubrobrunea TaxID=115335 RepID=A0A9W6PTH2_9ACTN|nr:DUF1707 domain-containing protein [Actinomadura rubrobrunea]GLW64180.1 hypothetical protein Arub01_24240 [Actinomadura rubrobrunea]